MCIILNVQAIIENRFDLSSNNCALQLTRRNISSLTNRRRTQHGYSQKLFRTWTLELCLHRQYSC